MPTNKREYQREYQQKYREKHSASRKVVSVSLPLDDFAELERYAKQQGFSTSKLLREASLHQARNMQMQSSSTNEELQDIRLKISQIANSLSELSYRSSRVKNVVDENEILQELKKLDELMTNFSPQSTRPK